jgi:hypothetical protein
MEVQRQLYGMQPVIGDDPSHGLHALRPAFARVLRVCHPAG